jgi:hypothetical protein
MKRAELSRECPTPTTAFLTNSGTRKINLLFMQIV